MIIMTGSKGGGMDLFGTYFTWRLKQYFEQKGRKIIDNDYPIIHSDMLVCTWNPDLIIFPREI